MRDFVLITLILLGFALFLVGARENSGILTLISTFIWLPSGMVWVFVGKLFNKPPGGPGRDGDHTRYDGMSF